MQKAAAPVKKTRSRLACQRCHNRRVRCDASAWGPPCSPCMADNMGQSCRLIESRRARGERGRFSFKPPAPSASTISAEGASQLSQAAPEAGAAVVVATSASVAPASETVSPGTIIDLGTAGDDNADNVDNADHGAEAGHGSAEFAPAADDTGSVRSARVPPTPSTTAPAPLPAPTQSQPASEADQWSDIISRDMFSVSDGRRMTYLGESFHLSYLIQLKFHGTTANEAAAGAGDGGSHSGSGGPPFAKSSPSDTEGNSPNLHIPIPPSQGHHMSRHDVPAVRSTRAPPTPSGGQLPPSIQRALIDAFFAHHTTLFPIIAEKKFRSDYDQQTVSPLLLSAVLYAGAIHVGDAIIYQAGFESRQACLRKLYFRAKALFFDDEMDCDAGDQLSRVQMAFLLQNMWLHPNATMDCWTWLSFAVHLAQNMGMHRSTARSSLNVEDRKLWKRIWWSLYSRDAQLANALGKPLVINEVDCDVERLSLEDFEDHHSLEVRLFVIEQARLADICRLVMHTLFVPRRADQPVDREQTPKLMHNLQSWKEALPEQVKYQRNCDPDKISLQALLLEVLYSNMLLLVHRPQLMPGNQRAPADGDAASWEIVFNAADEFTHITELIMNYKSIYHCPLFYTTSLFGSMLMHVIRGPAAEHQLGICMVATRTMATMYCNAGWVRNLFLRLTEKKRIANTYRQQRELPPVPVRMSTVSAAVAEESSSNSNAGNVIGTNGGSDSQGPPRPWPTPVSVAAQQKDDGLLARASARGVGPVTPSSPSPLTSQAPGYKYNQSTAVAAWQNETEQTANFYPGATGDARGVDTSMLSSTLLMDMSELNYMNHGFMESWEDFAGSDNLFN